MTTSFFRTFLLVLACLSLLLPELGLAQRNIGGKEAHRAAARNPLTGSNVSRPQPKRQAARPAPKAAPKPAARPAARPAPRPAPKQTAPAARPTPKPAPKPAAASPARPQAAPQAQPKPAQQAARPNMQPAPKAAQQAQPKPAQQAARPNLQPAPKAAQQGQPKPAQQAARPNLQPAPKAGSPNMAPSSLVPRVPASSPARVTPQAAPRPAVTPAAKPVPRPVPRVAPKASPKVAAKGAGPAAARQAPAAARRTGFVPGKVTYPGSVQRPANTARAAKAAKAKRPNVVRKPQTVNQLIAGRNVNSNNRVTNVTNVRNVTNVTNNRVTNNYGRTPNWGTQWTNNRASVWNTSRLVNNRPIIINPNFQRSVNYAYRPASWGSRPWWSNSTYHQWHHGSWNYGWNRSWATYQRRPRYHRPTYFPGYYYERRSSRLGETVAWGLAAWSLGSLAYDMGYNSYYNPYPTPPVTTRTTVINYSQPLSVVAAKEAPEAEQEALNSEEKSSEAIETARTQFRNGQYLEALKSTDVAISYTPGDSALHEFRALCLFSLGRYSDAAGVLNPVLASGPGWDWSTMASFYPSSETYANQRRRLEEYVEKSPNAADAHFLLGYHYMVAGFIDEAYRMFDRVTELQPADSVSAQLRTLAQNSTSTADETGKVDPITGTPEAPDADDPDAEDTDEDEVDADVEPIEEEDLEGTWKATSAADKLITLTLDSEGNFTWDYEGAADGKVLSGEWSIDDEKGQLILTAEDAQMVADIYLDEDTMQFILAGSPVGDPGLSFTREAEGEKDEAPKDQ